MAKEDFGNWFDNNKVSLENFCFSTIVSLICFASANETLESETIINDEYLNLSLQGVSCDAADSSRGCDAYAHDNNGVLRILREKMRLLKQ